VSNQVTRQVSNQVTRQVSNQVLNKLLLKNKKRFLNVQKTNTVL